MLLTAATPATLPQQSAIFSLVAWFAATPIARQVWHRLGRPAGSPAEWGALLIAELVTQGALALRDGVVLNA